MREAVRSGVAGLLGAVALTWPVVAGGLFQIDLFRAGEGGVHTYRIPALVETRRGVLIAVVDARRDSQRDLPARIALAMRRSFDRGATWSPMVILQEVKEGGVGGASLLADRETGRVWCLFNYGPPGIGFATAKAGARTGPETLQVHAMYSDDDGAHWSEPVDLTPQLKDPAWQAMFAASGTDIETVSGRYLAPLVVRDAEGKLQARNAYSDDRGQSWRVGNPIVGGDESHNVELAGGEILQNLRDGERRLVARSRDGGVTFGAAAHDAALVDAACNAGIVRYHRGGSDLLLFTNAASTRREKLTVKLSYDGGASWPVERVIESGPAAYSTVVVLRDGSIAVLYERGHTSPYERISFARFRLKWVTAGGIAAPRRHS